MRKIFLDTDLTKQQLQTRTSLRSQFDKAKSEGLVPFWRDAILMVRNGDRVYVRACPWSPARCCRSWPLPQARWTSSSSPCGAGLDPCSWSPRWPMVAAPLALAALAARKDPAALRFALCRGTLEASLSASWPCMTLRCTSMPLM